MNKLILKWTDKENKHHEKEYDIRDQRAVNKARVWLIDNGALDVDIAIRVKPQEIEQNQ
jgi:hypothetical protein